jgi:hypothetical protein
MRLPARTSVGGLPRRSWVKVIFFLAVNRIGTSLSLDFVQPKPSSIRRSRQRVSRHARWYSWVAWCALVALAWPSLGTLPWIGVEFAPHDHVVLDQDAESDAGPLSALHHQHDEASDLPGSPTHPADHDCFPCQILKHLSRCVPSDLNPPAIPWQSGCAVQPRNQLESQFAAQIAALPPARGPPLYIA